jgi:hypothetical protein
MPWRFALNGRSICQSSQYDIQPEPIKNVKEGVAEQRRYNEANLNFGRPR